MINKLPWVLFFVFIWTLYTFGVFEPSRRPGSIQEEVEDASITIEGNLLQVEVDEESDSSAVSPLTKGQWTEIISVEADKAESAIVEIPPADFDKDGEDSRSRHSYLYSMDIKDREYSLHKKEAIKPGKYSVSIRVFDKDGLSSDDYLFKGERKNVAIYSGHDNKIRVGLKLNNFCNKKITITNLKSEVLILAHDVMIPSVPELSQKAEFEVVDEKMEIDAKDIGFNVIQPIAVVVKGRFKEVFVTVLVSFDPLDLALGEAVVDSDGFAIYNYKQLLPLTAPPAPRQEPPKQEPQKDEEIGVKIMRLAYSR